MVFEFLLKSSFYHSKYLKLGNFPLEDHLAALGDRLQGYKKSEVPFVNKIATPWKGPKHVETTCALDPSKLIYSIPFLLVY